jgi:hypothetical protein
MKCPHGCKRNLKVKDDYPRTPKGLFQCPKCKCWFREIRSEKMKPQIVLVTRNVKCNQKEEKNAPRSKRMSRLQRKRVQSS